MPPSEARSSLPMNATVRLSSATLLHLAACSLIAIGRGADSASAAPAQGIQARVLQPVCPRGSVMMLPLGARSPGDHWPQTIELKLDDGQLIVGQVAWIYAVARPFERH